MIDWFKERTPQKCGVFYFSQGCKLDTVSSGFRLAIKLKINLV